MQERARLIHVPVLVVAAASACAVDARNDDTGFASAGTTATNATTSSATSGESDDGGSTAVDDGATSRGVTEGEASDDAAGDETGAPTVRCDKIDFLFVLETPEMGTDGYQASGYPDQYGLYPGNLDAGFASLVSALYVDVEVDDFRVLVTGSMAPDPSLWCGDLDDNMMCHGEDFIVDTCDRIVGAGRNGIATPYDGETDCVSGRWLDSGTPDLMAGFQCLSYAQQWAYSGGGPDTLMDAMVASLSPSSDAGTCNAGFIREDALLVVVIVEAAFDGLDDSSSTTADAWRSALLDAKLGVESNVVVLGLVADGDLEQSLCSHDPGPLAPDLRGFVESFPNGDWASVCLPDYVPFFTAASEMVDAACQQFTPAG